MRSQTFMVRSASSRVSNHDRSPASLLFSSKPTPASGVDIFDAVYRLTRSASMRSNGPELQISFKRRRKGLNDEQDAQRACRL
jgi:hypothetical protein